MRRIAVLLILALTAVALADRKALLIGIDEYPIVKGRQLSGAAYDLRMIGKMMECFNFQAEQLKGQQATREAIITKMTLLQREAKPGDEFVLYFSGRGSLAPPADNPTAKVGMEPTLVPYDGKETVIDYDLRMKRLEDWAQAITDKGGHATIILDTCFQSASRADFGRPYNPMPRVIQRKSTSDGEVRNEPYLGPGMYLAATPSAGSAYEYLIDPDSNTWGGAFTDIFGSEVIAEIRKGDVPTYSGAMREAQAYFKDKVRQDYMPGLAPYPFSKTLIEKPETYEVPMFGGVKPSEIPPPVKVEIAKLDDDRQKREQKLRIGLAFPSVRGRNSTTAQPRDVDDMDKERDPALTQAITKYVSEKMPYAQVQPPGAPVDLIVSLAKLPTGVVEARVAGDEVDRARNLRFAGKDISEIMKAGLADHLETHSLVIRLFRMLDDQKPTWDQTAGLKADKDTYKSEEPFTLTFDTAGMALLYIFDRDDADGIVQMTFPAKGAEDNHLPAGSKSLSGTVEEGTPTGKMLVRALFVEPAEGVALPSIGTDAAGLLDQLRVLVPAIEGGKLKWTTREVSLTVKN